MKRNIFTFSAFLILMVALGSSDSLRGVFSTVFSEHFGLSASQLGLIVTISYIGTLVFLMIGGKIIDRCDKRKSILTLVGIWAAACVLFVLTDNYILLLVGMFFSLGASTLLNTTLNLSTQLLFASSPALFVNVLFFLQGVGTTGSQSFWGHYAESFDRWKLANIVLLILGAISAVILFCGNIPEQNEATAPHMAKRKTSVLKSKAAWFLILVFGFYFVAEHGLLNWLVVCASRAYGMDTAKAANYLALFFGGIMAGRLLFSPLVDKLGILRSMAIFSGLGTAFYIAGMAFGEKPMFLLGFSGLFFSIMYPTLVMSVRLYFPANQVSGAAGTIISVASLFDILFNYGFGALVDSIGYRMGILVFPAAMAACFAVYMIFCICCKPTEN